MKQTIFEPYRQNLASLILPIEDFHLFCDLPQGLTLREEYRERAIAQGEARMGKTYPLLTLSTYLRFARTGNRIGFESLYFERRTDLMALLTAEAYEGQGRFMDSIMDLTWAIMEESSWVLPAHVNYDGSNPQWMPQPYEGDRGYTDLFAGTTGACLAWVWYLCRDKLDAISPLINQRILENLRDRVILPFAEHNTKQYWMGYPPSYWMNNWCPWIVSNVLTVCALTVPDPALRERVVDFALIGLDRFVAMYGEDGGCDEGPNYWSVAGGALYNACLVLYDMTGGKINAFSHPLIKNMGEFFPKMYISNGNFLNFADARSKLPVDYTWGHDWGRLTGSALMQNFWEFAYEKSENTCLVGYNTPYREFRSLCIQPFGYRDFRASKSEYFPSLGLSVCRDSEDPQKGLYLSLKGGHNMESHNHLDVGNFVIYCDGTPLFIDAGVGTYTARTFSADRYDIWSMQSCYHNLPTLNGVDQQPGGHFAAKNAVFEEGSGKLTLDLTAAYPAETGVESYIRSAWIENGRAVVRDDLTSTKNGEVTFNLLCNEKPVQTGAGEFTIHGKTVRYDPTLTFAVDTPDCTSPETIRIPGHWDCETLYRIRLTAALTAGKASTFQMEVFRCYPETKQERNVHHMNSNQNPYRLGLVSISFRQHTPRELLEAVKACGLSCIEWGSDVHAPCHDMEKLHEIAALQKEYGIECSSYGTYFRLGSDSLDELTDYIQAARILGTRTLRLWCGPKSGADMTPEELASLLDQCRKAAAIAEENDVVFCMESHHTTLTEHPEHSLMLMREINSPHFRMYWQPFQWLNAEENLAIAHVIAPYTEYIHTFQWKGDLRFSLSEGIEEWRDYLKEFSTPRTLLLEFMPDDKLTTLPAETAILKTIIGGLS